MHAETEYKSPEQHLIEQLRADRNNALGLLKRWMCLQIMARSDEEAESAQELMFETRWTLKRNGMEVPHA